MSFFIPGRLTCFICARAIGERVEAARLFYASEADVGEDAKRGQPWVHRACWIAWPHRAAWAASAAKLLSNAPGALRVAGVVGRATASGVLLQDTDSAVEVLVPHDRISQLASAVAPASGPHVVTLRDATWHFARVSGHLDVFAEQDAERFEAFVLEHRAAWSACLSAIASR